VDAVQAVEDIAARLADEGVPVAAIARATNLSASEIWEQLYDAWWEGKLIGLPRNDWPPNVPRDMRIPEFAKVADMSRDHLLNGLVRVFGVTRAGARLLLALIERHDVSNDDLHRFTRAEYDYEMGSFPVHICALRRKLKPFGLEIETIWRYGKQMSAADRRRALDLLMADLEKGDLRKSAKSA